MRYHSFNETANFLLPLIVSKKLIPVFGSGFTYDEKTEHYKVPNGEKCCNLFNGLLTKYEGDIVKSKDLMEVSEELFRGLNHKRIPVCDFIEILRNYFTKVKLSSLKTDFLNLPWPFAFTLNVDDGIESCSDFEPILPYHNVRNSLVKDRKNLYKLHGDANWECTYDSDRNLVFNFEQYVDSILKEENQSMREMLQSTLKSFNILFIGCSLKKEPDLKYVYRQVKNEISNKKNILVTNQRISEREEERLEDDYGITDIIVIENSNYDQFYTNIIDKLHDEYVQEQINSYDFTNPSIVKEKDVKFFTGLNIFDREKNLFHRSDYFIFRDLVKSVELDLDSFQTVIVGGRRFSGKTIFLSLLAEREKTRDVYFFPSDTQVDSDVIKSLCENQKDKLFLFDSNSLSSGTFYLLRQLTPFLKENNNRIVAILEKNDNLPFEDDGITYENLGGKFTIDECKRLNSLVNKIPLTARIYTESNLDYLTKINLQQKIPLALNLNQRISFTEDEQILMLILSVKEKVYEKDYSISLNITEEKIQRFLKKLPRVVEKVSTSSKESRYVSNYKLVQNSRLILDKYIRGFSEKEIIRDIRRIVSSFRHGSYEQKLIYRDVMKFDSLNQMFGENNPDKSASMVIQHVYFELQDLLNEDMHYWLQRAKCIYRINYDDMNSLLESYKYAKYVYNGSDKDRLKKQSSLSISLICARMAQLTTEPEKMRELYIESIEHGYEAIFSVYYRNEKYMRSILSERSYKKLILEICSKLCYSGVYDFKLMEKANEINEKLTCNNQNEKEGLLV